MDEKDRRRWKEKRIGTGKKKERTEYLLKTRKVIKKMNWKEEELESR